MGNANEQRMGTKILFCLQKSFYSPKQYSKQDQGNFHLKAHLDSLSLPFTDWITESVKRGMHLYLETLNAFLAGNL